MSKALLLHASFPTAIAALASRDIQLLPDPVAFRSGGISYGARFDDGDFMRMTMEGAVASFSIFDRTNRVFVCDLDHDGRHLQGTVGGSEIPTALHLQGIHVADLLGQLRETVLAAGRDGAGPLPFRYSEVPALEAA
ncbi:hypothetical protein PQI07_27240 [Methylobacterium sp. 092160098-2]|uniref:hypothetical protein n=1 Tax=Methylobacterium sp. 092160098-2 TaxID=3025129 RepID=UPI002381C041|nr:hypothetical protein [Methylobacterium sp. 092160098-2]MDE4914370.1 hypothetical protein [Methylobacterium sp. 092160098-2]